MRAACFAFRPFLFHPSRGSLLSLFFFHFGTQKRRGAISGTSSFVGQASILLQILRIRRTMRKHKKRRPFQPSPSWCKRFSRGSFDYRKNAANRQTICIWMSKRTLPKSSQLDAVGAASSAARQSTFGDTTGKCVALKTRQACKPVFKKGVRLWFKANFSLNKDEQN